MLSFSSRQRGPSKRYCINGGAIFAVEKAGNISLLAAKRCLPIPSCSCKDILNSASFLSGLVLKDIALIAKGVPAPRS
jgi:hypothetical protein